MNANHPASPAPPVFHKVGQNLYRLASSGTYYALFKRGGKQIRKSLKTSDAAIARRRLKELGQKVSRLTQIRGAGNITFSVLAKRWLESVEADLKPASTSRLNVCVHGLEPYFKGLALRNVTTRHCEEWMTKRGEAMRELLERIRGCENPAATDRVIPIDGARTVITNSCKRSGLPHFLHHSMRHYFCSNAIDAGVDFKVIAGWLGHSDGGFLVAKTYWHLRDAHSFEMAKRMVFSAGGTLPTKLEQAGGEKVARREPAGFTIGQCLLKPLAFASAAVPNCFTAQRRALIILRLDLEHDAVERRGLFHLVPILAAERRRRNVPAQARVKGHGRVAPLPWAAHSFSSRCRNPPMRERPL